ncbi:MAG: delta-60 repeat domain-containing protein [Saprospiraceae bacterium]|nr:delta-60 repeat domain-containing protein [Saprospiraceae bacterium]
MTSTIQGDGEYLGGNFTSLNNISRNRIARLYANGSLDETFNPGLGANDNIRIIAIQNDGKIIVDGFTFLMESQEIVLLAF